MKRKNAPNVKENNQNEKPPRRGAYKKIITSSLLWALLLTGCGKNIKNDEMVLNKEKQSITFVVEYEPKWEKVKYYVTISKNGDKYVWKIDKIDRPSIKTTSLNFDNLNSAFWGISHEFNNYQMYNSTLEAKDAKFEFAKNKYEEIILNWEKTIETLQDTTDTWDIVIKYKPE